MSKRLAQNQGFRCEQCGRQVPPLSNGSYRNHCPACLYSKHVDRLPGDRQSPCGGLMAPVGLHYHSKKGYQIVHRCQVCGQEQLNKAARNTIDPDDLEALARLPVI
jgi:hypothetical protein